MKNIFFDLLISMRPKQWTKNGFVFAALIFSRSFFNIEPLLRTIYTFILFSLVSGAVYIINDIIDRKKDAHHPNKCKRPIACSRVMPAKALIFSIFLLNTVLILALHFNFKLFMILFTYFILTLAYSLILKNVVILDVIIISTGFVLRTTGGAAVINVRISPWLVLCTSLLSLFLALNKRKNEMSVKASNHQTIPGEYSPILIDRMLSVIMLLTGIAYSFYTFTSGKSIYMIVTIPFVLFGIFRYQNIVSTSNMGGSPELILLQDKPLLTNLVLWVTACIVILALF